MNREFRSLDCGNTMSTSAMYKNIPPVDAKIHGAVSCADPMASPIKTPMRQSREEIRLHIMACLIVIPALNKTAKSPKI